MRLLTSVLGGLAGLGASFAFWIFVFWDWDLGSLPVEIRLWVALSAIFCGALGSFLAKPSSKEN